MASKYCPKCNQAYSSTQRFCASDQEVLSLKDPYHLVGNTLMDKYRIVALVGLGGMGAVYCAHHLGIDRRVAFKILQPNVAVGNDHIVELFEREAKLAGRLIHENIVDITDAGHTEDGIAYIVMEWLEGRTLDEELSTEGRFSFKRAIGIIRQISAALGEAHAKRIIHRDLKPGNIMLVDLPDDRDYIKVLDFGIGKALEETTANSPVSAIMGTPQYASPEQLTVGGHIDGRSDIYSLGVIFYRLLGGQLPFRSSSMGELLQMQLTAMPKPIRTLRPETPAEIEQLVNRMLAKDPAERPHSASEVINLLDRVVSKLNKVETVGLAAEDRSYYTEAETLEKFRQMDQTTETMDVNPPEHRSQGKAKTPAHLDTEAETILSASTSQRRKKLSVFFGLAATLILIGVYGSYRYLSTNNLATNNLSGDGQIANKALGELSLDDSSPSPSPSPMQIETPGSSPNPTASVIAPQRPSIPRPSIATNPSKEDSAKANPRPTATPNVNQIQLRTNQKQAMEHLERARTLYQQGEYRDALRECNESLRLNPQQLEARRLKRKIGNVLRILNNR